MSTDYLNPTPEYPTPGIQIYPTPSTVVQVTIDYKHPIPTALQQQEDNTDACYVAQGNSPVTGTILVYVPALEPVRHLLDGCIDAEPTSDMMRIALLLTHFIPKWDTYEVIRFTVVDNYKLYPSKPE